MLASNKWVSLAARIPLGPNPHTTTQLFELDGTIQRLTQTGADPESLVRLTAHYHGLLKAWTEI